MKRINPKMIFSFFLPFLIIAVLCSDFSAFAVAEPSINRKEKECCQPSDDLCAANQALEKALLYLDKVMDPKASAGQVEWSIIALARNDRLSLETKQAYLDSLKERVQKKDGILSSRKYTEYSRTVLTLSALGENPQDFLGFDFVEPIKHFEDVIIQGINGPIWALIALDSQAYKSDTTSQDVLKREKSIREKLIDYILEHRLINGGWGFSETPDDMTAMAIQALAPYCDRKDVEQAVEQAVNLLSDLQGEDGGFGDPGGAESISQVIIALTALDGKLLEDTRFVKNGNTLIEALLRYQKEDGSFKHRLDGETDIVATNQALLALTAYDRFVHHETRLYDMRDVDSQQTKRTEKEIWIFIFVGVCLCIASCYMLERRHKK